MSLETGKWLLYGASTLLMGVLLVALLLQCLQRIGWWPSAWHTKRRGMAWVLDVPRGNEAVPEL